MPAHLEVSWERLGGTRAVWPRVGFFFSGEVGQWYRGPNKQW